MPKYNFYGDWDTKLPEGHNRYGQTTHNKNVDCTFHFPCQCGGHWVIVNESNDYRGVSIKYTHYDKSEEANDTEKS